MHADDIPYMFNIPFNATEDDKRFTGIYCKLFTNFATYGTPTPEATADYPVWPRYSVEDPKYLRINLNSSVETDYTAAWRKGVPEQLKK